MSLSTKDKQYEALKTMVENTLGSYYIEAIPTKEELQILEYKRDSEKPIPLIISFWSKTPNNIDMPIPFLNLWNKIQERNENWLFSSEEREILVGHFWRLYLVYRHGANYNILKKQINLSNNKEILEFWNEQLPILAKAIRPYIIINRYIIMPLNRTINYLKRFKKI